MTTTEQMKRRMAEARSRANGQAFWYAAGRQDAMAEVMGNPDLRDSADAQAFADEYAALAVDFAAERIVSLPPIPKVFHDRRNRKEEQK